MKSLCASLFAVCALAGCGEEELPGEYFQVDLTGVENTCTGGGSNYSDSLEYRVELENQAVKLSIGDDLWAQGQADGCLITYSSIVWEDDIDGHIVRWQIFGSARINQGGGSGCVEESDWEGEESFVVLSTDHPDIQPGCTYDIATSGTWTGAVP